MKKIRFLETRQIRHNTLVEEGAEIEFPASEAAGYVRSGFAKYVKPVKPAKEKKEVNGNG